jgi:hypothetical protein
MYGRQRKLALILFFYQSVLQKTVTQMNFS